VLSTTFGGATWQHLLEKSSLLPASAVHSVLMLSYFAYALALILLVIIGFVNALNARGATPLEALATQIRVGLAMVGAFFLTYRGIDPQLWYGWLILLLVCIAVNSARTLPFITMSIVAFLSIESFSGISGFLMPYFLTPNANNYLGFDDQITRGLTASVIVMIALASWSYLTGKEKAMVGRHSRMVLVWYLAASLVWLKVYLLPDLIILAAMIAAVLCWIWFDCGKDAAEPRALGTLDVAVVGSWLTCTLWAGDWRFDAGIWKAILMAAIPGVPAVIIAFSLVRTRAGSRADAK
jgi:hypothetical protein